MEIAEYLWRMYNEHRTQQRHHETQRGAVTTVTFALAGAVVALLSQASARFPAWPLAVFLIVLGVFGAAFSLKQAERDGYMPLLLAHTAQLEQQVTTNAYTAKMLNSIDLDARKEHRQKWNWRTGGIEGKEKEPDPLFRLYWFFVVFNMLIAAAGVLILLLTLTN